MLVKALLTFQREVGPSYPFLADGTGSAALIGYRPQLKLTCKQGGEK